MRGCYSCLRKAFDAYDALRLAGYQPAVTAAKAFDAAILLALREKELAMEADGWIAKAAALAPSPEAGPAGVRAALYLDMARKARWAAGRLDEDQAAQFERTTAAPAIAALAEWERALGPPAARDLTGTYLMAALACGYTPPRQQDARLTIPLLAPAHRGTPLMQYAVGICRPEHRAELQALAGDLDFHEVLYQNARLRLFEGGPTVHLDAKLLFEAAREAMPANVANAYLLAGVHRALEEFPECAARYDEVIRLGGAARDAMLHRTECLTRGALRERAIASATELIDAPGIHRGEAFYHRAWNRYHLKELDRARSDVDEGKRLWVSGDLFALSGFIAYDMQQRDFAYTEFGEALRLNPSYCVARFYQGLIDSTREAWAAAASTYEKASTCYAIAVRSLEGELRAAQALEAGNPTRERRIANLTEGLESERMQLSRALYNTAYSFGRAGEPARGIPFAERAVTAHREMQKLAEELLAILRR